MMAQTTNFLAVDLGAASGRVLLAQWDGARFTLEDIHRFPNGGVQVQDRLYWNVLGLWSEIKQGLAKYAASHTAAPAGIGIDTWGVDFGLLDKAGRLLGNPVHYRDDRNVGMMERAFATVPSDEIYGVTGLQFMQFNTIFQLLSMRHTGDPHLDIAETLLMMPDLLHYWLTGRKAAEYTDASTTQMLDAHQRQWATDLLAKLQLPTHILPEIVPPGTILGNLLPDVANETGLAASVPIITPGTHDTGSAVAGIPGLNATSAYISSGTWSLMGVETAEPIINEQTRALNFTNEGGVASTIRLLKNIGGLWLLQECQRMWQRAGEGYGWTALVEQAEAATPFRSIVDPDAPDFMNPVNMLDAICSFCRRTNQPQPETVGQFVRCCLESLALRYRWTLSALEEIAGHRLETVRIVGGGSQNKLLCQFTADACQRLVVTGPVEATALGNVMMQAIATGHLAGLAEGRRAIGASIEQKQFEPVMTTGWDEAFARFEVLID